MDGPYDFPEMKDLADRQMSRLPNGALGALKDASVQVTDQVSNEEVAMLLDWKSSKIGDMDLFDALRKLRPPRKPMGPVG